MLDQDSLPFQLSGRGGSSELEALRLIASGLAAINPWVTIVTVTNGTASTDSNSTRRECQFCHTQDQHDRWCIWQMAQHWGSRSD